MQIDLDRNTIDGRPVRPSVVELAYVLLDGPMCTDAIIPRLFGVNEPDDAMGSIKQRAFRARCLGIPIHGRLTKQGRGEYWLAP